MRKAKPIHISVHRLRFSVKYSVVLFSVFVWLHDVLSIGGTYRFSQTVGLSLKPWIFPPNHVAELGLSVQAARNLYTGKVNPEVVSRLLENDYFANASYAIEQYCNGDLTAAFAAQNKLYTTLASALRGAVPTKAAAQAAADVSRMRQPIFQADTTTIQNYFMSAVREIKKEYEMDSAAMQKLTATMAKQIFENLTRGQDMRSPHITPDMVADAVATSISGLDGMDEEKLKAVKDTMLTLIQATLPPDGANGEN